MNKKEMDEFLDFKEAERGENSLYEFNDDEIEKIAEYNEDKPNVFRQINRCNGDGTLSPYGPITEKFD